MPRKKYLEAGRIVATHGIKGEVKVQPWCDSPQVLCNLSVLYFDNGKTPVKVGARPHKNAVIMKIEGVNSAQDAAALRGRVLYLDREDIQLDDGTYFIQDLIGL